MNFKESDFIGLSKKSAQNKAEAMNLTFRLIRIDNQTFFDYPEDKREDRICVEVDNFQVSKVSFRWDLNMIAMLVFLLNA